MCVCVCACACARAFVCVSESLCVSGVKLLYFGVWLFFEPRKKKIVVAENKGQIKNTWTCRWGGLDNKDCD